MIDNQIVNTEIGVIQRGWVDSVSELAPETEGLTALLSSGLADLDDRDSIDEAGLLRVVERAAALVEESAGPELAQQVAQRLRRTVYEYLLALDAASDGIRPVASSPAPRPQPLVVSSPRNGDIVPITDRGAFLIGAEEVAALEQSRVADEPDPAIGMAVGVGGIVSEDAQGGLPADTSRSDSRRRFGLFRRHGGSDDDTHAGATDTTEGAAVDTEMPASRPDDESVKQQPAAADRQPAVADDAEAGSTPALTDDAFAIMPRHGFHLGDPNEMDDGAPAEAPPEATSSVYAPPGIALGGDDLAEGGVDLSGSRRKIDEKLRKKKCDEAAGLLQQLAQEVGGREVAEMALDAGDRCRALGKRQAATNCYLAASRADPVYESPWARLADICIDDHDIDLAVSYLERVARLTRLRGDIPGSLRVYRKIVTVAPHREDIMEMLLRAQSTGHVD